MRIVTVISKGEYQVEYRGMSESEKLIVTDLTDRISSIIDVYVSEMVINQQFDEMTQAVADFIDTITNEICDMQLDMDHQAGVAKKTPAA